MKPIGFRFIHNFKVNQCPLQERAQVQIIKLRRLSRIGNDTVYNDVMLFTVLVPVIVNIIL